MAAMRMECLSLPILLLAFALNAGSSRPSSQNTQTPAQNQPQTVVPQNEEALEQLRADAEEGIKHMLVSQIEAWNHGQIEGFMQGYWRSPDLTFYSGGTVTKGWEPTLQRYRQR